MAVLKWYNETTEQWESIGGGGTSIPVQAEAPANPADGDLWFDTEAVNAVWTPLRTGWLRASQMVGGQVISGSITPSASHSNSEAYRLINDNATDQFYTSGSSQSVGMYARFDFNEQVTLRGIRMIANSGANITTDYARAWDIQGSNDATSWTTLGSGSASSAGILDTYIGASTFRYFQIILTTGVQNSWIINEVEFLV